jgi:hypothetical protein
VDGDVNCTADASIFKRGTKSCKLIVAAGCSAGDKLAAAAFTAKNLSSYTKIGFWIYSTVTLISGDLALMLDNTAACASPLETISIPAVPAANTWTYVKCTLANPATDLAIISVGIQMVNDVGGFTVYIDDLRALDTDALNIAFNTATFGMQEDLEESNAISAGRQPMKPTGGTISGTASMSFELNPYHAVLFKHALGDCVSTDLTGSKYSHVITIGDLPTGLAIEVQHTKELKYTVYHCKANTLKLTQAATGKVMCDIGFEMAAEETETTYTSLDESPTDYGHNPFSAKSGAFWEGGGLQAGMATNYSINYTNNIEGEPTIGSAGVKDSLSEGRAKVDFSMEILFKDSTILNKARLGTESSISLINLHGAGDGTIGDEKVTIDTPEVMYARPQQNIDGPRGLKLPFTGIAYYNDDVGGEAIKFTFLNAQPTLP